ncbi:hypothetical protein NNC19_22880 [Clostridium sp. SHJSY1]|uniref:hypothetical protein n=1 Tax=Clostridium sp. SHJSY1 TaxID=2942483 RepID=UPI002874F9D2|nr:hypothetical protein [Clostridium sp. SHJSY1]MDS0528526.1 hypothetical protein [Clostridium sp. SHJSY1]
MRYIGPFFRMNSLSEKDIEGQLFYLSREAIKTIVLNSKCGILSSFRASKKSSRTNNISILNDFSPLICLYRKSSPIFIHNKSSHGFDESSFKKDISPTTNALMTLALLNLSRYYSYYCDNNRNIDSLSEAYSYLSKEQLEFYYENLRNSEGIFVEKKNISDGNAKGYNLIDKNKKFNFVDQAFMMNAYYLYAHDNPDDPSSEDYKNFSLQILDMFLDFKDLLYNLSFEDGCKILLSFNVLYNISKEEKCKSLIIDLSDFLISKFDEKDYYIDSLDSASLFGLSLLDSFKHTGIETFKEKSNEIFQKLKELYNDEKGVFTKLTDKKEIKYSSFDICFYFLFIFIGSKEKDNMFEYRGMISNLYRKYFISSGCIYSWPDAPTLDETERYRGLTLRSQDMLDESYFRMPNVPSPESSGLAPLFAKNITYSKKKDTFSKPKDSFDSYRNLLIFFVFIHYFMDDIIKDMNFDVSTDIPNKNSQPIESIANSEPQKPKEDLKTDETITNSESNESATEKNSNDNSIKDIKNEKKSKKKS